MLRACGSTIDAAVAIGYGETIVKPCCAGRPIGTKTCGKKREHGGDFDDPG